MLEFLEVAFDYVGLNWSDHVVIDMRFFRPAEVDNLKRDSSKARKVLRWKSKVVFKELAYRSGYLKRDSSKARKVLRWKPKVEFKELVKMMVDEDVELEKRAKVLVDAGYMDAQQQP
ncbi:GDP-mannose 4,6 dehydratase 1 [Capsicum annuum]|uniref:GDP-mannose 4,6 dehydratase 1 n=1 Tax=Capsicum annuum TaxID=4072 RepID=A0A2G2ZQL5_CAPAN|nr:GDP-mannose 4,6 dehydratase 1 [Capsicum annuum]